MTPPTCTTCGAIIPESYQPAYCDDCVKGWPRKGPLDAERRVRYVLEHLRLVHPSSRTIKELRWWFVNMDRVGTAAELKEALQTLKTRHLARYNDPLGWQATA